MRELVKERIAQVIRDYIDHCGAGLEYPAVFSEHLAEQIVKGLDALLAEQDEGFVPPENEVPGKISETGQMTIDECIADAEGSL